MPAPLSSSSHSDKGPHRPTNEDAYLELPQSGVWAIADGMGGHQGGQLASQLVIDSLVKTLNGPGASLANLNRAIQQAHDCLLQSKASGSGPAGMGSTLVLAKIRHQQLDILWVGDSRAYLWTPTEQGGELEQLTTDHSYVSALLSAGVIDAHTAATHPERHAITRCLGWGDSPVNVDKLRRVWRDEQILLLCSDGLSRELNDHEIATILGHADNTQQAARQLLDTALAHGGNDNITLQLIAGPLAHAGTSPETATADSEITSVRPSLWISLTLAILTLLISGWQGK